MRGELPFVDRIWRVRNSLPLEENLTASEVFDRMGPLFQTQGTHYDIVGDTLSYAKENPNAQDKLATFTHGTLQVVDAGETRVLAYDLKSSALWICFLAPLLFVALGLMAMGLNALDPAEADRGRDGAEESKDKSEDRQLHWIDQMLGAPAPETKEEKEQRKAEEAKENGEEEGEGGKETHSYMPAFVIAGLFVIIYIVGRILEPYLIRRTFRTALRDGFVATPEGPRLRALEADQTNSNTAAEVVNYNDT